MISVHSTSGTTVRRSPLTYVVALAVTVGAILSQYFLPQAIPALAPLYRSLVSSLLIVYGVPVAAFALLVGPSPIRGAFRNLGRATWEGFRFTGSFLVIGILVVAFLLAIYSAVDPNALKLLNRPNPALRAAASNPYFWMAFSFVVGAVEETIFRGWIFGYWVSTGRRHLFLHAVWTSGLFAAVHLYYGTTYGVIAPIQFSQLFLIGLAYALTYQASKGNLVIVALLHGLNDAAAFSSLLTSYYSDLYLIELAAIGLVIALIHFVWGNPWGPPRSRRRRPMPLSPYPAWGMAPAPGLTSGYPPPPEPPPPPPPPPGTVAIPRGPIDEQS